MSDILAIRRLTPFGGPWTVLFGLMVTLSSASAQFLTPCIPDSTPAVPDEQMTVNAIPGSSYQSSKGTGYSLDCDPYYVVDITVPGNLPSVEIDIVGWSDSFGQLTQATCQDASIQLAIYKRSFFSLLTPPAPWKLISYQYVPAGTWVPGPNYCSLPHFLPVFPSGEPLGNDQYRVKVLPKVSGAPVVAKAGWAISLPH